jgi:hypothetical protein
LNQNLPDSGIPPRFKPKTARSKGASHRREPLKKGLFPDVSGAPKAA